MCISKISVRVSLLRSESTSRVRLWTLRRRTLNLSSVLGRMQNRNLRGIDAWPIGEQLTR
jgi:hypothetical protein